MRMTPMKAIRKKCLDCCAGQVAEVRRCTVENCPLFPYRMGHKPKGYANTPDSNLSEKAQENPGVFMREGACGE